jgi:hypothetical protein
MILVHLTNTQPFAESTFLLPKKTCLTCFEKVEKFQYHVANWNVSPRMHDALLAEGVSVYPFRTCFANNHRQAF